MRSHVVIYGSGRSLADLSPDQWSELREYDSIGFNWFVIQRWIHPTHMIVGDIRPERELNFSSNTLAGTYCKYLSYLDSRYAETAFWLTEEQMQLMPEIRAYKTHIYKKTTDIGVFSKQGDCKELYCAKSTLFTALNLAMRLSYKYVIFAGVDLYNYQFFWLRPEESRSPGSPDKPNVWAQRSSANKHPIHVKTLSFFEENAAWLGSSGTEMYSYNHQSLLLNSKMVKPWIKK